jgi:glycosyltransferase involved in cell wall biosynthesis
VSVVIPTYNRAAYLPAALDSVFAQDFPDLEVIVVDDCSTDETPAILARYAGRIVVIRRDERSHCPARVNNDGIRAASGEYLAFLDSDDMWLAGKLARQLSLLDRRPDFGFIYGNFVFLREDGTLSTPAVPPRQLCSGSILLPLAGDMFIHPSTLMVRRVVLDRAGLFDEGICTGEHYDLVLRLASISHAGCISEPVAWVRQHAHQYSRERGIANYESAIIALQRLLLSRPLPWSVRIAARRTLARHHVYVGRKLLEEGCTPAARDHLLSALRQDPLQRAAWAWLVRSVAGWSG